jgi:hypothetical protein
MMLLIIGGAAEHPSIRIGVSLLTRHKAAQAIKKDQCDTTEIILDIEIQTDPTRTERFNNEVNRESRNPQWKSMPLLIQ